MATEIAIKIKINFNLMKVLTAQICFIQRQ